MTDWWLRKIERALEAFMRWRCARRRHVGRCGAEVAIRWEPAPDTVEPWDGAAPH